MTGSTEELPYSMVPCVDEDDGSLSERHIRTDIRGEGRWTEVVKRHEELHSEVFSDEVIKQKEPNVSAEVVEEGEEVRVSRKC